MIDPKNIRVIAVDVDNTILPAGKEEISERVKIDLQKAASQGIYVFVNTGRHYTFIPDSLFRDLPMELIGTINGACLTDRKGKVLSKHPMSEEDMWAITKMCVENGIGLGFKFEDAIVTYANYQTFINGYTAPDSPQRKLVVNNDEKQDHHIKYGLPLGTFIIGESSVIEPFINTLPQMTFAWSFRRGYDVFLKRINKATVLSEALDMLGYTWDQVIAFGDAGNDIPFVEKAGIGVAMGNGKDNVLASADLVAPTCEEDGVAKVLEDLGIVK